MNAWLGVAIGAVAIAASSVAAAADVEIRNAAARVTVIPEARSDIVVSIYRTHPHLPLRVSRMGDTVRIDGRLGMRSPDCRSSSGRKGVSVWGAGFTPFDALPQVMIRTPKNVKVRAGGAIFGAIGRADSVELANAGCGDWTIANVSGPADIRVAGSGDVRAGSVGSADVRISGSSNISINDVRNGLMSATSGSGDLSAGAINGPLHVRVAGSGDVVARGGQVTDMVVSVAGSGDVRFGGVAQTLRAAVAGSGDVNVGRVTGTITKHVAGSGSVNVGG
jgi:hypothetical protein